MQTQHINDYKAINAARNGDEAALAQIIESNLGLVRRLAVRFTDRGTEYEDLVQIGTIGMIKAIRKFDISYNTAFSTYAVPMIIGEIKRFLRDDGIIKIGRTAKKNASDIAHFCHEYRNANGCEPTIDEIITSLGLTKEDAVFALEATQPVSSIYRNDDDDSPGVEDIVGEQDEIEKLCDNLSLRESLSQLEASERMLITLRYFKNLTQQQTAKVMGCSQVKISREEKRIFQKLKKYL
ncbi:MAG: sigma-70 family RNA polymerase sigma factor [Ruminococcaceae bacterium]|nr:sigma-70 family RNA polymerase sigma factor [Oscillospiraceae bacterium]